MIGRMCASLILPVICYAAAGGQPARVRLPAYTREALPNGAVLLLMPRHDAPLLTIEAQFRGGAEADPPQLAGLGSVVAKLLRSGTETRTARVLANELEDTGANFQTSVDAQSTVISLEVLPQESSRAIDVFADAILRPVFPASEVRKTLLDAVAESRSVYDDGGDAVWRYFRPFYFGAGHPYAHPDDGDEATLTRIRREDILRYYARIYTAANLTLIAVGDFDPDAMRSLLTRAFRGMPRGQRYHWAPGPSPETRGPRVLLVDKPDAPQTDFLVGLDGISRNDPDRLILWLVNNIVGGTFTSVLNESLRVQLGLTYGCETTVSEDRLRGPIVIESYTATRDAPKAIGLILDNLRDLARDGISQAQLDRARNYIEGQYPPDNLQTTGQLADLLGDLELFGFGREEIDGMYERLDRITVAEANAVLRRYFQPQSPTLVLVGPAAQLRPLLAGDATLGSWAVSSASVPDAGDTSARSVEPVHKSRRGVPLDR